MSEELKSCPFCGSENVKTVEPNEGDWYATCNGCGANTSCWTTEDEVSRRWNSRAEPKVTAVDGFGKEVHAGDWVFACGECRKVERVESKAVLVFAKDGFPTVNAHGCSRCPLGADGNPLLIGETVYDDDGIGYTVGGYGGERVRVRDEDSDTRCWIEPGKLTHEAPDSWEQLEEDLSMRSLDYCDKRGLTVVSEPSFRRMAHDVVARAKKLAGIEGGE